MANVPIGPARVGSSRRPEELERLLAAVCTGDGAALTGFYDATSAVVFSVVLRLVGDRPTAEEVTLDVYLQVWRRALTFSSERGRALAWLLTIARSRALDRVRSRRASAPGVVVDLDESLPADRSTEPSEAPARGEQAALVRKALAGLPGEQRRALELAFDFDLSHAEIATRLGEPLGTIKTRIRLGMIKLREMLRPLELLS